MSGYRKKKQKSRSFLKQHGQKETMKIEHYLVLQPSSGFDLYHHQQQKKERLTTEEIFSDVRILVAKLEFL